jgi:predicted peptidase
MRKYILFFFLFNITAVFTQELYLHKVSKVKERTYTYQKIKNKKNLKLDFYKPKNIKGEYPLLVYVHGGGFSGGNRDDVIAKDFANEMASYGYAVASISYRLTMKNLGFGCSTAADLKLKAFDEASADISNAIQYILKRNRKFNINKNKIVLVGSSAGAETILNLAYTYKNTILEDDFNFAGIISMSGALKNIQKITKKNAIPTQLFHGKKDELVPYATAAHHYCLPTDVGFLTLYGSRSIADQLKKLNKSYYLYSIEDGDHSWNSRPIYECKKEILDFLYVDVLNNQKRQIEKNI